MRKKEDTGIVTVPHRDRPDSLEAGITGIPKWKQDVFNLVALLTKYRLRNKITQKELAERLKVKQSVIARFEKLGRFPTIEFLYKVAEGLGMRFEISLKGSDKPYVPSEVPATDQYYQIVSSIKSDSFSIKCEAFQKASITVWDTNTIPWIIALSDPEKALTGSMGKLKMNNRINLESYSQEQPNMIKNYISAARDTTSEDLKQAAENANGECDLAA